MLDSSLLAFAWLSNVVLSAQPQAPSPVAAPLRELLWGQVNFLHTTDTHGWHAGHLQELVSLFLELPGNFLRSWLGEVNAEYRGSYSADWGDYISFSKRMKEKADSMGVDLLLIDTGDRIEGNGLYDGSTPVGKYTSEIFKQQEIDVVCSGNHELYKRSSADTEFWTTVPNFKGNYLASNLDYIRPDTGERVPMASRFRKFITKYQGIRILAFGFLFDFTGSDNNTFVQPVEETVKEKWFQDAIRDTEIDLFLVAGHVAVRSAEYTTIHKAIRSVHGDTPMQFFGGHFHIRDYKIYDHASAALASGRYMETIGFMSIDGIQTPKARFRNKELSFQRRYIDNNLFSFYHHTGLNQTTFHTHHGQKVSEYITHGRKTLMLDSLHGCAPQDYWLSRSPYGGKDNIYTWLETRVLPEMVINEGRREKPRLSIINTGAMRFDIFKGPFTRDTTYIVSPFTSAFRYIKDVPYDIANKVLPLINGEDHIFNKHMAMRYSALIRPEQICRTEDFVVDELPVYDYGNELTGDQARFSGEKPILTPGYITSDDGGRDGDDTIHTPISFYRMPNCVQGNGSFPGDGTPKHVDLVFLDFIEPYIILALRFLGQEYSAKDVQSYLSNETLTTLIARWVEKNWDHDC